MDPTYTHIRIPTKVKKDYSDPPRVEYKGDVVKVMIQKKPRIRIKFPIDVYEDIISRIPEGYELKIGKKYELSAENRRARVDRINTTWQNRRLAQEPKITQSIQDEYFPIIEREMLKVKEINSQVFNSKKPINASKKICDLFTTYVVENPLNETYVNIERLRKYKSEDEIHEFIYNIFIPYIESKVKEASQKMLE